MKFKALFILFFATLLCFLLTNLSAQPPQFQSQLNNMRFNNQMSLQNQMFMQMMNMRGARSTAGEFDFVVMLLDSTKLKVTSAMYIDSASGKRFIVRIDKRYGKKDSNRYKKIYPSQTLYLKRDVNEEDGSSADLYYRGKPNDTCWMYKVVTGPITAYSWLSDRDFEIFDPSTITGLQLNGGPIVIYSIYNLAQMIESDKAAMEYFQNQKYVKAIRKFNRDTGKKM